MSASLSRLISSRARSELPLSARHADRSCLLWAGTGHWAAAIISDFAGVVMRQRGKVAVSPVYQMMQRGALISALQQVSLSVRVPSQGNL